MGVSEDISICQCVPDSGTIKVAILFGVPLCSDDKCVRSRTVIVRRHDIDIVSCKLYWVYWAGGKQQCQLDMTMDMMQSCADYVYIVLYTEVETMSTMCCLVISIWISPFHSTRQENNSSFECQAAQIASYRNR